MSGKVYAKHHIILQKVLYALMYKIYWLSGKIRKLQTVLYTRMLKNCSWRGKILRLKRNEHYYLNYR